MKEKKRTDMDDFENPDVTIEYILKEHKEEE